MRKVACLAVFMALMMLVPVQAGGDYSVQQADPKDDDPRQPTEQNKTLYMFWNESNTKAWTHFQIGQLEHGGLHEENENGLIDIDLRFRMEPTLAKKRIYMDADGLFRGSFNILCRG